MVGAVYWLIPISHSHSCSGLEEITVEDAEDLYIPEMTSEEFRQSAKAYFDGLVSVLDMQGEFLTSF